ncbi:hypothetical protein [Acinetobacter sp. A47]|uniref:hypothetical protein n=1 Tax=Acinetobacter sp. A47 TaxID=1561217 RepID=UPI00056E7F7A|nr:hypothetical protein [Acinetobacter sp. A47]
MNVIIEDAAINYCKIKPEVPQPVKRIPDPLVFPFSVFMQNGGYSISPAKDGVSFKKGKYTGKIKGSWSVRADFYEMNEHCINRFKMFTELYLKGGKKFIEDLTQQGFARLPPHMRDQTFLTGVV